LLLAVGLPAAAFAQTVPVVPSVPAVPGVRCIGCGETVIYDTAGQPTATIQRNATPGYYDVYRPDGTYGGQFRADSPSGAVQQTRPPAPGTALPADLPAAIPPPGRVRP
jgi:hypothetical protein